jgi:DNA-binding response OmpR family regulator
MSQAIHILIIEDDPAVGASLQEALTRDGYTVTWKTTGNSGVAFARDHQPQLIVLDVRLPDGSGFDFCGQMRRMRLRQPIVMLTARRDEVDKVIGLEVGADDYVTKPFSLSELRSRIRAQVRRAYGELAPGDGDLLYASDIVIDRGRGQVMRGSEPLHLTPTELRLLVTLVQHRGQVLSRQQLLGTVWGYNGEYESEKTVTVHIRRLREKIEADPTHPILILTVPGLGYRFAGE